VVAALVLPVGLVAVVVVNSLTEDEQQSIPAAGSTELREQRASFLARLIPPPPERVPAGPRVARGISDLIARMTIDRKVAQLFLWGFQGQDLNDPIYQRLRTLDLGGIVIDRPNYSSSSELAALAGEAGVIAEQEGHVPPWVLAPQEGGEFNAFPDLPPASAAADLRSDAEAFEETRQAAGTLKGLGINGVLAPVVDVAPPDGIALGARAYSDDPRDVSAYATAVVDAYRGVRVLTAASHFPGLGSGTEDTQLGVSQIGSTIDQLRGRDLVPFRAAIRAGVPAVLMSNGLYATDDFVTPGSLSRPLIGDLLRGELGFEGIVITDDLADPPITALGSISDGAVKAIKAGADLVYISGPPGEQQTAYVAALRAARSGEISERRLDEALLRNLAVKRDYALIE